jgi:hypothetical protein
VEGLLSKYPAEVVALYLHAFCDMNETKWTNLETLLQTDERLKLPKSEEKTAAEQ